jgi:hypothetical protein
MNMFPLAYDFDKSFDVYWQTEKYISEKKYDERISKLFIAYLEIGNVIPQTTKSFWSGHYFPYTESWDELQISFNLVSQGFYKQTFYSLRSSFELGLLSVYWNLNDDGHNVIQEWLKSEEDTPRFNTVWGKLNQHKNFSKFQEFFDIKARLSGLGYLHDYVHSKGLQHSNTMGKIKSNFQTFENDIFDEWFKSFEEIINVLIILHLIKYPIGTIKYDFRAKFGIDIPSFGGIDIGHVELFEELVGAEIFKALEKVAKEDEEVKNIMEWVESRPDMTEEEQKGQILDFDTRWIEQMGFNEWLKMEMKIYEQFDESDSHKGKIETLRIWAEEQGFMKSKIDIISKNN